MDGLRAQGIRAEFDHVGRSFKAQFKYADKLGARKVAILGDDELSKGCVKLKDMASGEERLLPLEELAGALKN
ncbi:Histidine--tRNA ligase [bioreactor metagenome]|uniref:Histidine--tRNA ligase n=1 Tax=bioreactor metagenome TaxID=1076179 RepID=A0A645H0A0_9ZZZZ